MRIATCFNITHNTKLAMANRSLVTLFEIVSNVCFILYCAGKQVYQLYIGRRTVYGKLTHEKSRDGAWELTDREKWTRDKFHFLKGNISRVTGSNISSVSIKNNYLNCTFQYQKCSKHLG